MALLVKLSAMPSRREWAALVRRTFLRMTAPKICRQKWRPLTGKVVRICDMDNAHLLNALHCGAYYRPEKLDGLIAEARRRRLPTATKPAWLLEHNAAFGKAARSCS